MCRKRDPPVALRERDDADPDEGEPFEGPASKHSKPARSTWVAEQLGRRVVKAFNNILAESLRQKGARPHSPGRVALSAAGDPPQARAVALRLIDELGFDPIDAGPLDDSWRQQPGTPAYCRDLDAASLKRALADADRSRLAMHRRFPLQH